MLDPVPKLCTNNEWNQEAFLQMLDLEETPKREENDNKGTCNNLPLFAMNYEMNFVYKFDVDDQNRPMLEKDQPDIKIRHPRIPLLKSDFPKNEETVGIVEDFAKDQQLWAKHFLNAWEKMQKSGYKKLMDDPSKLSYLGYSFLDAGM